MTGPLRVVHLNLDGYRLAVAGEPGRKYVPVIPFDFPVRVVMLPKDAQRRFERPPGDPRKCTLRRVARLLLKRGRQWGITQRARELLQQAEAQPV